MSLLLQLLLRLWLLGLDLFDLKALHILALSEECGNDRAKRNATDNRTCGRSTRSGDVQTPTDANNPYDEPKDLPSPLQSHVRMRPILAHRLLARLKATAVFAFFDEALNDVLSCAGTYRFRIPLECRGGGGVP
jgi:hypothetical protein